MLTDWNHRSL